MLNTIFVVLLALSISSAHDFGKVYNRSSILVNFIDENDAKLYDERKITVFSTKL